MPTNMSNQVQLTKNGFTELEKELNELVDVKRPKLVERLSYARQQGDLSENSDYINAREELEFLDGRISELNDVLKNASIVKTKNGKSSVDIGMKVTVRVNGQKHVFDIVGEWEADPINKKISPNSPLGSALVGKKVGEKANVEAPAGKVTYEVLAIN